MLHITNGDCAAALIREAGVAGDILSWIDALHEGPVPENLDLDELRSVRARFIESCGWATFEEARDHLSRRDRGLLESLSHEEVVLWFEHDLYDQLQLIQILDWFALQDRGRTRLTLICGAEYLGMSSAERLRDRYPERKPIAQTQLDLARQAWAAFRSADPFQLVSLLRQDTSGLPFLSGALWRHLQQFPSTRNGLSRTEQQALETVASGVTVLEEVYRTSHHGREEAFFLADALFALYIERLSVGREPLVIWEDGTIIRAPQGRDHSPEFWNRKIMLTPMGRAVLEGAADQVKVNGIDRWLGGVHLSGMEANYRWDESTRTLLS